VGTASAGAPHTACFYPLNTDERSHQPAPVMTCNARVNATHDGVGGGLFFATANLKAWQRWISRSKPAGKTLPLWAKALRIIGRLAADGSTIIEDPTAGC